MNRQDSLSQQSAGGRVFPTRIARIGLWLIAFLVITPFVGFLADSVDQVWELPFPWAPYLHIVKQYVINWIKQNMPSSAYFMISIIIILILLEVIFWLLKDRPACKSLRDLEFRYLEEIVIKLEKQCIYCSRPLAMYPLIMCDDASQTVYHVTCALELASDLLADVFTFFSPPAPYPPLFVLTPPQEAGRCKRKE